MNDYHKALQQVNTILNIKDFGIREDIIKELKLLNIIVHYELGNEELLPSLCKSTNRHFEKKGEFTQIEKLLLNFFSNTILKADTKQEKKNAFVELKKELAPLLSKKKVYEFDFISWIESKIEGRSFVEDRKSVV